MIKEFAKYIENGTSFVLGTNLFEISTNPNVTNECIVVAEPAPGLADGTLEGLREVPLVIYARAITRFTARDNAYVVFDLLHRKMQVDLPVIGGGDTYTCNIVCSTPYYNGLDETTERFVYVMPLTVTVTNMS